MFNIFRVVFHPSSEAHITVFTVSSINETSTATCRERDWAGTAVPFQPDAVDTVLWAPDDGWNTIRNMLSSWQI